MQNLEIDLEMRVLILVRNVQDAAAVDSDEEDEFIYNPLKLPMGWDGKPIPYWLYKLHGLNQASLAFHQTAIAL